MINVQMWIATVVAVVILVFLFTTILQRRTTQQNAIRICSMINERSSCSINSDVCVYVQLNSRERRHDIPSFLLAPTNPHCLFQPATNDSLYNLPFASQTVLLFAICKSTEKKVGILRMNFFGRKRPLTDIPFHILFDMLYVPSAHRGQQIARTLLQTAAKVVEQYMTVKSIASSLIYFTGNFSSTGNPTKIEYQWSLLTTSTTTPPLERDDLPCVLNSLFEQKKSISKSSASFILRKIPVLYQNNTPCLAVEWHPWTKETTETAIVLSGNPSLFVSTMEAAATLLGMSAASPFVLVIPVLDILTPSCADGFQVFCREHISLFSFGRATSFKLEEHKGETAHGGFYLPSYV